MKGNVAGGAAVVNGAAQSARWFHTRQHHVTIHVFLCMDMVQSSIWLRMAGGYFDNGVRDDILLLSCCVVE